MVAPGDVEVTVVLPTRDRWSWSEVALASALAQEDVRLEVCVVDDGSISPAPLGFDADPRVRLFRHERSRGVAASRNRAIDEARGGWVAFLDDDDLWAPWHLRLLLDAAREQDARWAFSGYVMTDDGRAPVGNGPLPLVDDDCERQFLSSNPIGTPSAVLVATEVMRSAGGFDERTSVMADWDLWLRLLPSFRPAVSQTFSVGYAQHAGNMSLDADRVLSEWGYMASRHHALLTRLGVLLADNDYFWRWLAKRFEHHGRRSAAARYYMKAAIRGRSARDAVRAIAMVPVLGWPVLLRRRIKAALDRRAHERKMPSTEYDWLKAYRDEETPAAPAEAAGSAFSVRRRREGIPGRLGIPTRSPH